MQHRTAWITGASPGIGRALARRGLSVAASARIGEALTALAAEAAAEHMMRGFGSDRFEIVFPRRFP